MNNLVIGMGQIGKPIYKILSAVHDTAAYDQLNNQFAEQKYDVIHICFGHKPNEVEDFKGWVKEYQDRFLKKDGLTVIHSTVSIGVSRTLNAVHSPVRGQHPYLEEGIRTFVKFFGGNRADEAAEIFRRAGLRVHVFDDQETTELGKLSETTFYALMIEYVKELKRTCDKYNLSFTEVYTLPAMRYNDGWKKLGEEYRMPILSPMMFAQQGHCTIPNCSLWDNLFTDFITSQNDKSRDK